MCRRSEKRGWRPKATNPPRLASLSARIESNQVKLIDVRSDAEWKEGHIAGADHRFLGRLPDQISQLRGDQPIVAQCLAGGRSAIAASLLQAAGFSVINMTGGYRDWVAAGLPQVKDEVEAAATVS